MKVFSVHYRHEDGTSVAGLADEAVLVKEGFSWPALFLGPLWLAWRGMWLVLAFYAAVVLVLAAAVRLLGLSGGAVLSIDLPVALLLAFEGNGLYRWTLGRRRYKERGVTIGACLAEAEERFLSHAATHGPPAS